MCLDVHSTCSRCDPCEQACWLSLATTQSDPMLSKSDGSEAWVSIAGVEVTTTTSDYESLASSSAQRA